jgi:tetratricopeptide (TPR) repeat protein
MSLEGALDRTTLPFAGHVVVFTGKLASLCRKEAQALVAELGGSSTDDVTSKTTLLVIGAAGGAPARPSGPDPPDDGEKSRKLRKAEQVNSRADGQVRILAEDDFCTMAGLTSPGSIAQQFYGIRDIVGMYPGLREDHLRYLAKWGLIQPVGRTNAGPYYRFPDLVVIRQAHADLARGIAFRAVVRSAVSARDGQLALDFRPSAGHAEPAKVLTLARAARAAPVVNPTAAAPLLPMDRSQAVHHFLEGFSLDDGDADTQELALAAYRRALAIDPDMVPALVNLANIHYAREERIEAQALYERALRLDGSCFEAQFNLGHVFHDTGRYAQGEECYRQTLTLNPTFADAHFYLAVTLEKTGRSAEAKPHWRAYQQLAPNGEWVELAREFSE